MRISMGRPGFHSASGASRERGVVGTRGISPHPPRQRDPASLETILAGLRYVWEKKIILGSISLDLFAMFFGGAVALLPVFARDVLHTGPWGLGLLRSAPGVGAAVMAGGGGGRARCGGGGGGLCWGGWRLWAGSRGC